MARKKPDPVDIFVGNNIRLQRLAAGLSQEKLADELGLSFQQIQKYEKGQNRVGASRMLQIAKALRVPITTFFEGAGEVTVGGSQHVSPVLLLSKPGSYRLATAFALIESSELRSSIIDLVEQIAAQMPAGRSHRITKI